MSPFWPNTHNCRVSVHGADRHQIGCSYNRPFWSIAAPPSMSISIPGVNFNWMKASRARATTKEDRTAATTTPSMFNTINRGPMHAAYNYTPPQNLQRPAPVHSLTTKLLPRRSGSNSSGYTTTSQELDPPDVKILYVLSSIFLPHRSISTSAGRVMGATGSGKSSVCFYLFFWFIIVETNWIPPREVHKPR